MFSVDDKQKLDGINGDVDLLPYRLQDHSVGVVASILENGRSQRFLGAPPLGDIPGVSHEELVNAVRELRWEGFIEIETEDVDGDGIPDDIFETGWKTNDSGLEFLRRLKEAAGI